jgi:RNA polymerase sigma-70 factor (ECF subfamily)
VALMALQAARAPARVDSAGDLVLLDEQDRSLWDERLMALGFEHFDQSIAGPAASEYHVQAAIAATYARAGPGRPVQWPIILELYDQLLAMNGSPVIALNRAVALARVHGPQAGLTALEPIAGDPALRQYPLLLAARGHFLFEAGRLPEAAECFKGALAKAGSEPERRFLRRRLEACGRVVG